VRWNSSSAILGVVTAVAAFGIVMAVQTGAAERKRTAPREADLISVISQRQSLVDDLDEAVTTLREDVATAQRRASRETAREAATTETLDSLGRLAGTVPLRGSGLVVVLSPSDREPPSPDEAGAYEIHDTDVQLVVNALFAAGAEAVAVNDSRLVATTPIRAAGDTIIVNFRPLSPPFRIAAIGARRRVFEQSDIVRRFHRWSDLFGLGFRIRDEKVVTVPGFTGRVSISSATPRTP
jgi:uncharacterized protein YlxW (UPF0749 family)